LTAAPVDAAARLRAARAAFALLLALGGLALLWETVLAPARPGGSWLALQEAPGSLPGDGWAQLTTRGQRGKPGDRGERGLPGPEGRGIANMFIDEPSNTLAVDLTDGTQHAFTVVR